MIFGIELYFVFANGGKGKNAIINGNVLRENRSFLIASTERPELREESSARLVFRESQLRIRVSVSFAFNKGEIAKLSIVNGQLSMFNNRSFSFLDVENQSNKLIFIVLMIFGVELYFVFASGGKGKNASLIHSNVLRENRSFIRASAERPELREGSSARLVLRESQLRIRVSISFTFNRGEIAKLSIVNGQLSMFNGRLFYACIRLLIRQPRRAAHAKRYDQTKRSYPPQIFPITHGYASPYAAKRHLFTAVHKRMCC